MVEERFAEALKKEAAESENNRLIYRKI